MPDEGTPEELRGRVGGCVTTLHVDVDIYVYKNNLNSRINLFLRTADSGWIWCVGARTNSERRRLTYILRRMGVEVDLERKYD